MADLPVHTPAQHQQFALEEQNMARMKRLDEAVRELAAALADYKDPESNLEEAAENLAFTAQGVLNSWDNA